MAGRGMMETLINYLSEDNGCWIYVNFWLIILKFIICNILRILFNVAAYVTYKFSLLLTNISEQFKTAENIKDLAELLIKKNSPHSHYCNQTASQKLNQEEVTTTKMLISRLYNETINQSILSQFCHKILYQEFGQKEEVPIKTLTSRLYNETIDQTSSQFYHEMVYQEFGNEEEIPTETSSYQFQEKTKDQTEVHKEIYSQTLNNENVLEEIIIKTESKLPKIQRKHSIKNSSLAVITRTLKQNEEFQKWKYKDKLKLNDERLHDNTPNDESPHHNYKGPLINELNDFEKERNSSFNQNPEDVECFELDDTSSSNFMSYSDDQENSFETFNKINDKETRKYNYHENRKTVVNEKLIKFIDDVDIFSLSPEFSLAYCVTEDFMMSRSISVDFIFKFGKIACLLDQKLCIGDVGEIVRDDGQYVFYLIVKKFKGVKPLLKDLKKTLINLRDKMNKHKLTKLAIPKSGLDSYYLMDVKEYISKIFAGTDIEISIYSLSTILDLRVTSPPRLHLTSKHLWDMEPQTDIIMFIDMEQMYYDSWNDKVVEMVNARYPFKKRFLEDIKIKPLSPGHVFIYKIDSKVLFCILVRPLDNNPLHFTCMEKAFNEMKSHMKGFRYLGIQREKLYPYSLFRNMCHYLLMLKNMFSYSNAEIWICGNTDRHRIFPYSLYKRTLYPIRATNRNVYTTPNRNSGIRTERRTQYTSGINCTRYESAVNNINNSNSALSIGQKSNDNQEENWDCY